MTKFTSNAPAIDMTMVGFGQAGNRMVDLFAKLKKKDGTPVYNCLALNSNDGDLEGLQHISKSNMVSLNLGGLGKNPEKAIKIIEEKQEVKEKLKTFITERVRPSDELVLFFAGLGGGTGTSTIIKAIEEFNDYHNKPIIKEELLNLQKETDPKEFKQNLKRYMVRAMKNAENRTVKIGVVASIPVRDDGPDVLRQVNEFSQRIWKLARDKSKGISFVIFPDNQKFSDEFESLTESVKSGLKIDNYRDYANLQIRDIIHEINTATSGGGTSVTFDKADFKRLVLEHNGCLVLNKVEKNVKEVTNEHSIKEMFMESIGSSYLHDSIQLIEEDENGNKQASKVHHVGLLAVLAKDKPFSSSFIDSSKKALVEQLPINGTVFSGYLVGNNDYQVSAYTFYKTEALPTRLAKGLVTEYEEFRARQQQFIFKNSAIASIAATSEEDEFDSMDIDLSDFGISLDSPDEEPVTDSEEELDIDSLDFSDIEE